MIAEIIFHTAYQVNSLRPSDIFVSEKLLSLVQIMACRRPGILLIGPLGTNFSGILIEIHIFSPKKTLLKVSSAKCGPFCLGLNVLRY